MGSFCVFEVKERHQALRRGKRGVVGERQVVPDELWRSCVGRAAAEVVGGEVLDWFHGATSEAYRCPVVRKQFGWNAPCLVTGHLDESHRQINVRGIVPGVVRIRSVARPDDGGDLPLAEAFMVRAAHPKALASIRCKTIENH